MNKQDKELYDKITSASDNVSLPESLGRDNIVKSLDGVKQIAVVENENNRKKKIDKKRIINAAVSVAAAAAIVVGIGAVGNNNNIPSSQEGGLGVSNVNEYKNAGYSSVDRKGYENIENIVADFYKAQLKKEKNNSKNFGSFSLFSSKKDGLNESAAGVGDMTSSSTSASQSTNYSSTNLQVDGIDEGDIVKTDGKNIYVLSHDRVYILDISDPKNIKTLNSFPTYVPQTENEDYDIAEMYLTSGKLITVVNVYDNNYIAYDDMSASREKVVKCYAPESSYVIISVYDVSVPTEPTMEFSYVCDGSYVSSRIADGKFIYVGQYDIPFDYSDSSDEEKTEYVKANCVPTESVNGNARMRIGADNICVSATSDPTSYQMIASFDINNCEDTLYTCANLGRASDIYCDGEYLFVSSNKYDDTAKEIKGVKSYSSTEITVYKINNGKLEKVGDIVLPGNIIGQFSMDRYNGYFRVAVNTDSVDSMDNYIFIINDKFEIVSRTDAFGKDEDMQSVRFMGDTAYAVTFYRTDPLFVIDLSDVNNPVIVGELKIPGFSSYLHPVGENLLLGVGEGGDENGTNGTGEIKLFDVSDPKNPKCVDTVSIDNAYINDDHKAFVSLPDNRYGVVFEQSYSNGDSYSSRVKIAVIKTENGKISKADYYSAPANDDINYTRAVYAGSAFFAVGDSGVISYDLDSGEKLGTYIYYD